MAEQIRAAGVSAEDLVAAIRVHLDRVHDAVRRAGADPGTAVEVVQNSALDLVEVVAARPETVEDAVGWWFARALALARQTAQGEPGRDHTGADVPLGHGVLSGDEDQQVLAEALDQLPERERVALLLRDSYDLPDVSVGAALGTDADSAMTVVGRARLAYIPLVDDEPAPTLAPHQADLGALARLGEGGPVAARDATVRRHALSCQACRAITDAQQRTHLLLTGLAVVALPDADRAGVLGRIEDEAYALLPTSAALVLRGSEELTEDRDEQPRLFSPLLAMVAMVLATMLGLGAGLLLSRTGGPASPDGAVPVGAELVSRPPDPPATLASPPTVTVPAPQTSVFLVPSPSPSPSPSPAPAEDLGISIDPDSGPNGQTVIVDGVGWPAGTEVTVVYLDTLGDETGSRAVGFADDNGRFSVQIVAQDPSNIPGPHVVQASDGDQTAEATYDAQP